MALAGPAAEAAQLAAKLGFRAPPIEFRSIRRPDYHPLLESNAGWDSILVLRVNDPVSELIHSQIDLAASELASNPVTPETTLPYPSQAAIANLKGLLQSWRRTAQRLTPGDVRLVRPEPLRPPSSPEMLYFLLALLEELRQPANLDARVAEEEREFQEYVTRPDVIRQVERQFHENAKQYRSTATIGKPPAAGAPFDGVPGGARQADLTGEHIEQLLSLLKRASSKRGKSGVEKWRRAQKKLLKLLSDRELPKTLRKAASIIGETYDTTRRAALRSDALRSHFGLSDPAFPASASLLEELAAQADRRTQNAISLMTNTQRQECEAALCEMEPQERLKLLQTLAVDPDAGSTADVSLLENADQRRRTKDHAPE